MEEQRRPRASHPGPQPQSLAGSRSLAFANSSSEPSAAASGFVKWLYKVWKSAQDAPVLIKQRPCLICILSESPRIASRAVPQLARSPEHWLGEVRYLQTPPLPSTARDTQWFSRRRRLPSLVWSYASQTGAGRQIQRGT